MWQQQKKIKYKIRRKVHINPMSVRIVPICIGDIESQTKNLQVGRETKSRLGGGVNNERWTRSEWEKATIFRQVLLSQWNVLNYLKCVPSSQFLVCCLQFIDWYLVFNELFAVQCSHSYNIINEFDVCVSLTGLTYKPYSYRWLSLKCTEFFGVHSAHYPSKVWNLNYIYPFHESNWKVHRWIVTTNDRMTWLTCTIHFSLFISVSFFCLFLSRFSLYTFQSCQAIPFHPIIYLVNNLFEFVLNILIQIFVLRIQFTHSQ